MRLKQYFSAAGWGSQARLSAALGVSAGIVADWANGDRAVPPLRCVRIEAVTLGAVMRWDLRDDWHELWPELKSRQGAPAIPLKAA